MRSICFQDSNCYTIENNTTLAFVSGADKCRGNALFE